MKSSTHYQEPFEWLLALPYLIGIPTAIAMMILHSLGIINIDKIP